MLYCFPLDGSRLSLILPSCPFFIIEPVILAVLVQVVDQSKPRTKTAILNQTTWYRIFLKKIKLFMIKKKKMYMDGKLTHTMFNNVLWIKKKNIYLNIKWLLVFASFSLPLSILMILLYSSIQQSIGCYANCIGKQ